jgi:hypothetical protein
MARNIDIRGTLIGSYIYPINRKVRFARSMGSR